MPRSASFPSSLVPKLCLGTALAKLRFARSRASIFAFPSGAWERGHAERDGYFRDGYFRALTLSAVGKSSGTLVSVTLPVAAHSVPRCRVTMKPTHSIEYGACP